MKPFVRLAVMLTILSACTATPLLPNMSPQEAQRVLDGQTNTAISYGTLSAQLTSARIVTEQAISDAQTATMLPVSIRATQQAVDILRDQATSSGLQTATTAALRVQTEQLAFDNREMEESIWTILKMIALSAMTICVCLVLLAIGYTVSVRTMPDTFQIVTVDNKPWAYRWRLPNNHWVVQPIETLALETVEQEEHQLRLAYCDRLARLARAAAEAGTWSIDKLSHRSKAQGVTTESAVVDLRLIGAHLGQLRDHGGSRGWDYCEGCSYITLTNLLAHPEALRFPLPLRVDGTPKDPPIVADPKPRQAGQDKITEVSPIPLLAKRASGKRSQPNAQ